MQKLTTNIVKPTLCFSRLNTPNPALPGVCCQDWESPPTPASTTAKTSTQASWEDDYEYKPWQPPTPAPRPDYDNRSVQSVEPLVILRFIQDLGGYKIFTYIFDPSSVFSPGP